MHTEQGLPPRPPLPPGLGFGEVIERGIRLQKRFRRWNPLSQDGAVDDDEDDDAYRSPAGTPRGGLRAFEDSPPRVPPPRAPADRIGLAPFDDGGDPSDDVSEDYGEPGIHYRLSPRGDPEDRRIFLHNVPFCFSEEDLRCVFSRAGDVQNLRLYRMRDGRSRGEGLCEYSTAAAAARALRILPGTWLHDDEVGVERRLYVQMHREEALTDQAADAQPVIRRQQLRRQRPQKRVQPRRELEQNPHVNEGAARSGMRQNLKEVSDGRKRKIPGSDRAIFFYRVPQMVTKQLLHRLLSLAGRIRVLKRLVTSAGVFKGMGICEYHNAASAGEALHLPGSIEADSALGRLARQIKVKPHTGLSSKTVTQDEGAATARTPRRKELAAEDVLAPRQAQLASGDQDLKEEAEAGSKLDPKLEEEGPMSSPARPNAAAKEELGRSPFRKDRLASPLVSAARRARHRSLGTRKVAALSTGQRRRTRSQQPH